MRVSDFIFVLVLATSSMGVAAPAAVKVAAIPAVAAPVSTVKSFKTWKAEKLQQAQNQVDQTRLQIRLLRSRAQSSQLASAVQSLNQQLAQEEWNLEVAGDLAVTDYLVLYLAQQAGSPMQLTEAASKLTPLETAQVLEAYIRSMGSHPSIEGKPLLPVSALNGR